jgi:nickel-type superoxide dismutase maturation protease
MITLRRVVGNSMYPTYKNGQVVVVSPLKKAKVGSVVMAVQNKREVMKRIVKITNDHMVELRGDNAEESTDSRTLGPVTMNAILGVVVWPKR